LGKFLLFVTFLSCNFIIAEAQKSNQFFVRGILQDSSANPINKGVAALVDKNGIGYAFARVNSESKFTLIASDTLFGKDSLFIKVTSPGYLATTIWVNIPLDSNTYIIKMPQEPKQMPPVIVKSAQRGFTEKPDTTSFPVKDFRSIEDRVIADVIRRIPGLSVEESGIIKFNGKTVSKVYIEGDNLLDGKYMMATNNIPASLVEAVQVIDHEQPIKSLSGYISSDNVALNLQISSKQSIVAVTTAEIGVGNKGNLVDLWNMLLGKKVKLLNKLEANSFGNQISNTGRGEMGAVGQGNTVTSYPVSYLTDNNTTLPSISKKYYYDNKDIGASTNFFKRLKNDYSLRFNISGTSLHNNFSYRFENAFLTPFGNISFLEAQEKSERSKELSLQFLLEKNSRRYYVKNAVRVIVPGYLSSGKINNGSYQFNQSLPARSLIISDEVITVWPAGRNQVVQSRITFDVNRLSEKIVLTPGLHKDVLEETNPLSLLRQLVSTSSFAVNTDNSYKIKKKGMLFSLGAYGGFEHNQLNSSINYELETGSQTIAATDSFLNNIKQDIYRYGLSAELGIVLNRGHISIGLMPGFENNTINDYRLKKRSEINFGMLNPRINIRKSIGKYGELNNYFRNDIKPGTLQTFFSGNILQNYREFVSYKNVPLLITRSNILGINYFYKRPLKMLYFNISLILSRNKENYTRTFLPDKDITIASAVNEPNIIQSALLNGSLSKYLYSLKTNFTLFGNKQISKNNNYIAGIRVPLTTRSTLIGIRWDTKIIKQLSVNGKIDHQYQVQFSEDGNSNKTLERNTSVSRIIAGCKVSLPFNILLSPSYSFQSVSRTSQRAFRIGFWDMSVRYTPVKHRGELEITACNLGNKVLFRDLLLFSNGYSVNEFPLINNRVMLRYYCRF
jgi:hypothetical protein